MSICKNKRIGNEDNGITHFDVADVIFSTSARPTPLHLNLSYIQSGIYKRSRNYHNKGTNE